MSKRKQAICDKTKKEIHKENGKHWCFRPTYCFVIKIFPKMLNLTHSTLYTKVTLKIYSDGEIGSAVHVAASDDAIKAIQPHSMHRS
jgi:hypothetical protein